MLLYCKGYVIFSTKKTPKFLWWQIDVLNTCNCLLSKQSAAPSIKVFNWTTLALNLNREYILHKFFACKHMKILKCLLFKFQIRYLWLRSLESISRDKININSEKRREGYVWLPTQIHNGAKIFTKLNLNYFVKTFFIVII